MVSHDWDELTTRIEAEIAKPLTIGIPRSLSGWINDDRFELTIRMRRHNFFMPLVTGRIDPTSKGSLLFLTYTLFPATRFFLLFWTVVLPLIGVIVSYQSKNYWYLGGFIFAVIFIYLVAWSNFRLHLKTTRQMLHHILNE